MNVCRHRPLELVALGCLFLPGLAYAGITTFFQTNQVATLVATGSTWDTISGEGYLFTYTRDKLFTGGVGLTNPIGRTVRVPWPQGVEAQAITTGPSPGGARLTIARVDGQPFDLPAFTFKLLANTAGAGAMLEIMPQLNGEDALNDPIFFDATGYYGSQFSYTTASNYWGSTAKLTNYTAYKVGLYVDFAFTALTAVDRVPASNHPPASVGLSGSAILENEPAGTWIGTLSAVDPDAGDTFTYALAAGAGGADNGLFSVVDGDLYSAASFNYETRTGFSIRVAATDQGGLSVTNVFAIEVLDVVEPPPEFNLDSTAAGGALLLRWFGLPNHRYAVCVSTNLMNGFSVVQSNIPADAVENVYTTGVSAAGQQFWMITTEP